MTTISMKLDTGAVRSLIGDDPEMKLELQRSVIANVARDAFSGYFGSENERLFRDVIRDQAAGIRKDLSEEALVRNHVQAAFDKFLKGDILPSGDVTSEVIDRMAKRLEAKMASVVRDVLEERRTTIEAEVEKRIGAMFDRMTQHVQNRLETLEADWKAEMARQIRADVLTQINAAMTSSAA